MTPLGVAPSKAIPRAPWGIVGIAMAFTFATQFNRVCMPVAGDLRIMDAYKIDPVSMGQVYSAFLLAYTIWMTPGGWLVDRFGPRASLAAVGFGSAAFIALTGAWGLTIGTAGALWWALVATRGLMGAASAPIYPAVAEVSRLWFPSGQRALANGLIVGASPLGVAATYVTFGALIRQFGWPSAFLITGAVTAALAVLWTWYTAGTPPEAEPGPTPSAPDKAQGPWWDLLRDRSLVLLTISYAAVGYFQFLFFYWMNHYFMKELDLGESKGATYAAIPPLAMALGIPVGGWLSDRATLAYGARSRGWVAAGGMVLGAGLLALGVRATDPVAIVTWFGLALGAVGISESSFWITAVERGGRRGGTAAGIMNTGGNLGGMIAPVLTPWVGIHHGWSAAIGLGGLIGLLGAACWLGIVPIRDHGESPSNRP